MIATQTTTRPVHLGMRVHCILYGGRNGTIVRLHGESRPENIVSFPGLTSGGNAEADIVWDDGTTSNRTPESLILGSVQWRVLEDTESIDNLPGLIAMAEAHAQQLRIEAEVKLTEKQQAREKFIRDHPTLEPGEGSKHAAKNIRRQLKAAFPAVRFSVTSDCNSINIRWEDGPTNDQVEDITSRYKAGHFDGMTDCYEYNHDRAWPFGDAKYIFGNRSYGPGTRERLTELGQAYFGDQDRAWELDELIRRVFAASEIPAGHQLTGIRCGEQDYQAKLTTAPVGQ